MTLFDVIRYPISMPPTMEELAACPEEIYKEWTIYVFGSTEMPYFSSAVTLGRIYKEGSPSTIEEYVKKLRTMIQEME